MSSSPAVPGSLEVSRVAGPHESYNDDEARACPLLRKMAAAGLHGRQAGRGLHTNETD
jgi:hypothetical protein